jgi:DNA-binding GntR family transcriptional regulator
VREAIYQRILTADLAPGRSVGEIALGQELGASRTPLREALIELQSEGLLEHDPGRGFVVRPLTAQELRDVYPIIAALDSLAVELAPRATAMLVERLRAINTRFASAARTRRVALDTEWHDTLAGAAKNERLSAMLRTLRRVIQRYEMAYLSDEALVRRSVREHESIAAALASGDRRGAARRLREHWNGSIERLLARLEKK